MSEGVARHRKIMGQTTVFSSQGFRKDRNADSLKQLPDLPYSCFADPVTFFKPPLRAT